MSRTDITAINAKTISINGTPIAGSAAPVGLVTTFDQLDANAVLALNGTVVQGTLLPGMAFSNFDNINVLSGVSLAGVVKYGTASTTASGSATGPTYPFPSGGVTPTPTPTPGALRTLSFASVAGFGDSMMAGAGASSSGRRYINIVATALGASVYNAGIGSTFLTNNPDKTGLPRTDNGRDRTSAVLAGGKRAFLVCAYGVNDERYMGAPASINLAGFKNDLRECMNIWFVGGYTKDTVALASPFWVSDNYLTNNPNDADFNGQTQAGLAAHAQAVKDVATEFGAFYAPVYEATLNQTSLVGGDGLHPNDAGHTAYANTILDGVQLNLRAAPTGVTSPTPTPGSGIIDVSLTAAAGAVSYDYYALVAGVMVVALSDVAATTARFTGMAENTYRIKARAKFSDGTYSPWAFAAADVVMAASAGGPGVLRTDDFNDAASGALWSTRAITLGTGSPNTSAITATNALRGPTAASSFEIGSYGQVAVGNGVYAQATFIALSNNTNLATGLALRHNNSATSTTGYLARYNGQNISLQKLVAGAATILGTNYTFAATVGSSFTLRLEVGPGFQRVYLNGDTTPIITATDATDETGGLGLNYGARFQTASGGSGFGAGSGAHLDNLVFGAL